MKVLSPLVGKSTIKGLSCFLLSFMIAFSGVSLSSPWYWRLGAGYAWSSNTTLLDKNCSSTSPAPLALFGCGHSAGGDFGHSEVLDLAFGYRFNSILRSEIALNYQPDYRLEGNANFASAGSNQPVQADVSSLGVMAIGYVDLASAFGYKNNRWQPFVGLGLGAANNHIDPVIYEFPALSNGNDLAITKTLGGNHVDLAYLLTAGIDWAFSPKTGLQLSYRWYDLGDVKTDAGPAYVHGHGCWGNPDCVIDVAETKADLKTQSVILSVWHTL